MLSAWSCSTLSVPSMLHPAGRTSCHSFSLLSLWSVWIKESQLLTQASDILRQYKKVQNCLVLVFYPNKYMQTKSPVLFKMKESPHKTSRLSMHSSCTGRSSTSAHPKSCTINHLLLHILLLNWGMFSCCCCKVSPEERQVEGLSFNFTVLLVSSQLATPRTEISHWHLLHFLFCHKHLASFRDKCYVRASQLKENTIVNTMLSIRNSSSVHLSKVKFPSPTPLPPPAQGTEPFKGRAVCRTCEQGGLTRKTWVFLGVNKQLIGRKGGEMNPRLS